MIDVYTEFPWDALCGEVVKMKIVRRILVPAEGAPVMTAWKEGAVGGGGGGVLTRKSSPG